MTKKKNVTAGKASKVKAETGDGKQFAENGDGRPETGDGKPETEDEVLDKGNVSQENEKISESMEEISMRPAVVSESDEIVAQKESALKALSVIEAIGHTVVKPVPVISVLMAAKDTPEEWLGKAISSIVDQDFGRDNFEIILVDDGSKDELAAVIREMCDAHGIILIRHDVNKGCAASLNDGLAMCRGKYVAHMDSDDIAEPNWLKGMHAYMESHPEAVVAGCQLQFFGAGDRVTHHPEKVTAKDVLAFKAQYYWAINHPGAFMRRDQIVSIGGYGAVPIGLAEDFNLWCNVLKHFGALYNNPQVLMNYRYVNKPERYNPKWFEFLEHAKAGLKFYV